MNEELNELIKNALQLVAAAGGTGVLKTRLLAALRKMNGRSLTPEEQDEVWGIINHRGWIESHIEPLWHNIRWSLTPSGQTALEAM